MSGFYRGRGDPSGHNRGGSNQHGGRGGGAPRGGQHNSRERGTREGSGGGGRGGHNNPPRGSGHSGDRSKWEPQADRSRSHSNEPDRNRPAPGTVGSAFQVGPNQNQRQAAGPPNDALQGSLLNPRYMDHGEAGPAVADPHNDGVEDPRGIFNQLDGRPAQFSFGAGPGPARADVRRVIQQIVDPQGNRGPAPANFGHEASIGQHNPAFQQRQIGSTAHGAAPGSWRFEQQPQVPPAVPPAPPNIHQAAPSWQFGSQQTPQQTPAPAPSTEEQSGPNDVEIVCMNKGQQAYAEMIEAYVRDLGLTVDLMFPNANIKLGHFIWNLSKNGTLFAVIITPENALHQSVSVHVMSGSAKPEEHRNMPLDDCYELFNRKVAEIKRRKFGTLAPGHASIIQGIFDHMFLSDYDYKEIIAAIEERWRLQRQLDQRENFEPGTQLSSHSELHERVLACLGMNLNLNDSASSDEPLTGNCPPGQSPAKPTDALVIAGGSQSQSGNSQNNQPPAGNPPLAPYICPPAANRRRALAAQRAGEPPEGSANPGSEPLSIHTVTDPRSIHPAANPWDIPVDEGAPTIYPRTPEPSPAPPRAQPTRNPASFFF